MISDQDLEVWGVLSREANALARQCMADPAIAGIRQVVPIYEPDKNAVSLPGAPLVFNVIPSRQPRNEMAAWLRGAARKIVPEHYTWMVRETFGGGAFLVLLDRQ